MMAFNLFRRRKSLDLYCAVPEDLAVPAFIASERWTFGGKVGLEKVPAGFNLAAAQAATRFNGFYVFQGT